ncbi:hypothetical protein BXU06_04810 [Aquaspirillum sp. LM1]|uniref:hypothetical protein n=1 Tax=Aquaspirillum sp. LM1 TaxID=1938604 RepID=UPI0009839E19|nr:hypothetical protein [Aquaspirillum sp. LM1]AQR64456.1 hypothetical protein BXU06_04810 [Aquaspirillum sp. LM1]
MTLSSLSDSLRLRLQSFAGRLRTTGQPAAATAAAQPAPPGNFQGVSDRVTLGASQEAPTLYDKQGMLSGGSDATAMRKQATDKVAELKKRMKWLKAMMTGASPAQAKGLARQLALVAGELKQAVKQFAGSSGQAASAPQASAGTPSAANASADASAQAAAPLQAEGQAMAAALSGDAVSQSSAGSAESTPAFAGPAATSSTGSAAEADAKSRQDFIQDAKAVASDIKRALEALKRKLRQSGQDAVRQTEKLLHEVSKMLNALGQQATPAAVSGSLTGGSEANVSVAGGATGVAEVGSVEAGSVTPAVSAAGQ